MGSAVLDRYVGAWFLTPALVLLLFILVGPFGDEANVEGRLVKGGTEVGAGRRLRRAGRSRTYLDGSIASAAALDDATAGVVEIIGQHDQLSITRPSEVRRLVDGLLDDDGRRARDRYRSAWDHFDATKSAREAKPAGTKPAGTAKPQPARITPPPKITKVFAVRPDRDHLEIQFPRVRGYRTEPPRDHLTAEFTED